MTFASPELLLGLLLVPLAIGVYLLVQRRRNRYAVRFTNVDLLANIVPKSPAWRRHIPPVLYLAAITALVIGLARPSMVIAIPREEATIILTLDVSRSMRAVDVEPTRLAAAQKAAGADNGNPFGTPAGADQELDPASLDLPPDLAKYLKQ